MNVILILKMVTLVMTEFKPSPPCSDDVLRGLDPDCGFDGDVFYGPDLGPDLSETIRETAKLAYQALDAEGMARVDFLVDRETHQIYVNELNSLPGFTSVSMYPKLWEATGLAYPELLDRLIELALERHALRSKLETHAPTPLAER